MARRIWEEGCGRAFVVSTSGLKGPDFLLLEDIFPLRVFCEGIFTLLGGKYRG